MNKTELEFFEHHKIDLLRVYNAEGLKMTKSLKILMNYKDFHLAYNTYPCSKNDNHTIKLKTGHCAFCNPKGISILKREHGKGFIYIAASRWGKWIKIGCTINYERRQKSLNENKGYGFRADWIILAVVRVDEMGVKEREIQNFLNKYREYGIQYYRGRDLVRSNELFRCSYKKAHDVLKKFCTESNLHLKVLNIKFHHYNFRNLIKNYN
ncbi:GIY-YIG nuclease family protein [Kaistella sp. G5-32]|uniref:GIY-YIG nuclease family protein n=1 Tax=Kaistella gelatinilytica TaxID=2787636 RepID=A0ABS0FCR7_9FLAO|nr:GIY-YIG nuclease family protein [Kaistella gelatinilytica]MBF8457448.1 GIY-YIG nuclease family protein [Kaistella gelatinilytica]